jgi:NADH-quinone oxidoreductase subunit N
MAVVSVYYYFKVIQSIYFKEPGQSTPVSFPRAFSSLLLLIALLIISLGVYPEAIFSWLYF